ncbi:MAG: hypothetical protein CMF62_06395 [Magnetococcales bacterium]|nr:hypothetical protein [Magnetococcales bacterium]|tara:strand:- start:308383 stop:308949 length:567 start_codon:yes stop_codon:yes gene_type:complete
MSLVTKETICDTASQLIGAGSITSFDDPTAEAKKCRSIWPTTLKDAIEEHPWTFSVKQLELNLVPSEKPLYGFKYAFRMPPDLLKLLDVNSSYPHRIVGNLLFTDAEKVEVSYQYIPDPQEFKGAFTAYLEFVMASKLAIALQDDKVKAQEYERKADKKLAVARSRDSQQQSTASAKPHNFGLTNRRW